MEQLKNQVIGYIEQMPVNKLATILDFVQYVYEKDMTPLDDFDYELLKQAKEAPDEGTYTFAEVLERQGLTYADLQHHIS